VKVAEDEAKWWGYKQKTLNFYGEADRVILALKIHR